MIQPATPAATTTRVPILLYHGVVSDDCEWAHWTQLPLSRFVGHMKLLRSAYRVLPLQDVISALQNGTSLPHNAAAVTFDDGFANNFSRAFPVLQEFQIPATIFLATGFMSDRGLLWTDEFFSRLQLADESGRLQIPDSDNPVVCWNSVAERNDQFLYLLGRLKQVPNTQRLEICEALADQLPDIPDDCSLTTEFQAMTWDHARAMHSTGLVDFGAHTVSHPILSRLNDSELKYEIETSCHDVADHLGSAGSVFAYPNGQSADYDARVVSCLKKCGIPTGVTTVAGLSTSNQDAYGIRRIPIGNTTSLAELRFACNGLMEHLRTFRHYVRAGMQSLRLFTARS